MITTKQVVCMIRHHTDNEMEWNNYSADQRYQLIVSKIKRVTYGVRKTSVQSEKFYSLDAQELESNTAFVNSGDGCFLVNEPFVVDEDGIAELEDFVKRLNEREKNNKDDIK